MTFDSVELIEDEIRKGKAEIKIIGIGGGGCNAVNRMIESGLGEGVLFIAANTDRQALDVSRAELKLPLGENLTHGLGAGGIPEIGEKAANENKQEIKAILEGADMVFITAGMGGGTGTGGAPVVAEIAKDLGILTVAVVTTPFLVEGTVKERYAQEGISKLRERVDTLIIIPNENLFKYLDPNTPLTEAFKMADDTLRQSILGISNLITGNGVINVDFADVKTTMKDRGDAVIGIGEGHGENKAVEAINNAIHNKLIQDISIDGATNVLVGITSGTDFTTQEFKTILSQVNEKTARDAHIIHSQMTDEKMNDSVEVTIIATGCSGKKLSESKAAVVEAPAAEETAPEVQAVPEPEPEAPVTETRKPEPVRIPDMKGSARNNNIEIPAIKRGFGEIMKKMRKGN